MDESSSDSVEQDNAGLLQNLDPMDSPPEDPEEKRKDRLYYDLHDVPPPHIILIYSIQVTYAFLWKIPLQWMQHYVHVN